MRTRRPCRERGTTALEMAALVPLAILVMFAFLQAGFTLYGVTAAQTAARQGARADALGRDAGSAVDAALPSWLGHDVKYYGPGHGIQVDVHVPAIVPGMGVTITREAVMP